MDSIKGSLFLKRTGWWIGLIGAVASLFAFAIMFLPSSAQKDQIRQALNVGTAGVAGMSNSCNVSITVNPGKPEIPVYKQPQFFPGEIDYRDLANPGLSRKFVGTTVLFRALYISEWNLHEIYKMAGLSVDKALFINHRSTDYATSISALGSTDSEIPPFPISISSNQVDIVRKLKRGDFILIRGTVDQPDSKLALITPDYCRIQVSVTEIQVLHVE